MSRSKVALAIAALVALTALTYLPALRNGFIWDDDDHLTANPAMTAPDGMRKIWSSLAVSRYYPLTLTNFWVQHRLWGLNPLPYHAVNIALHGLNAALLFVLLRRLNVRGAWVAAALWTVHPVNVESVAWITELKNTQSGLFFFLSLLCFLNFEEKTSRGWYAAAALCFAAALLSKPSTVVLPPVLLLIVWWERRRWQRADFIRVLPFFALALAMSLLTVVEQSRTIARAPKEWALSLTERLALAGKTLWFYAGKLLWPAKLTFVYPRWELNADSFATLLPVLVAFALGLVLWQLRQHKWARACLFGFGYFFVALLPVLDFFDIYYFRYSFVADHFQYLAAPGVIALVTAGAAWLLQQRLLQTLVAALAIAAAGMFAWQHTHAFHDDETLWHDTLAKNPGAFLAYNNLGAMLNIRHQYVESERMLREALRLKPNFLEAHSNLGFALTELGRYPEAEQELFAALRMQGSWSKAHYCLGRLYYLWKRPTESEKAFRLAILAEPTMVEAYYDLGALLQEQGRRDEAADNYRKAIALRPDYVMAHSNLAKLLVEQGKIDEATQHFEAALRAAPDVPEVRYNFALILRGGHHLDEAVAQFRKAIELKPATADAYLELGRTLAAQGKYAEVIQTFRHGLEVEPRHMVMGDEMAWIMATAPDPAVRNAPQAIQIGERLVELTHRKELKPLDTLAAAYAEAGRFDDAARTAREALALAQVRTDTNSVVAIEGRLRFYEQRQPYRLTGP